MEALEKRVDKCENKIDVLSKEVVENTVNMGHFQRIMERFEKFSDACTKTLIKLQDSMENLTNSHEYLKQEVSEIKGKVEENEDLNKVDTRIIRKQNLMKLLAILSPIGWVIFILYSLFGQ